MGGAHGKVSGYLGGLIKKFTFETGVHSARWGCISSLSWSYLCIFYIYEEGNCLSMPVSMKSHSFQDAVSNWGFVGVG